MARAGAPDKFLGQGRQANRSRVSRCRGAFLFFPLKHALAPVAGLLGHECYVPFEGCDMSDVQSSFIRETQLPVQEWLVGRWQVEAQRPRSSSSSSCPSPPKPGIAFIPSSSSSWEKLKFCSSSWQDNGKVGEQGVQGESILFQEEEEEQESL